RRRHTRSKRDWSSDVCLPIWFIGQNVQRKTHETRAVPLGEISHRRHKRRPSLAQLHPRIGLGILPHHGARELAAGLLKRPNGARSEERRVGKEHSARWSATAA